MAVIPYPGSVKEAYSGVTKDIIFFNGGEEYIINTLKKKVQFQELMEDLYKVLKGCQCCITSDTFVCNQCPYNKSNDKEIVCWEFLRDDVDLMLNKIGALKDMPNIQRGKME